MKDTLVLLAKSLLKTVAIAGCVAFIAYLTGTPPVVFTFVTAIIAQFVYFYGLNRYMEYKAARDSKILFLKEAELLARNTVKVACANCKKESEVVVNLNDETRFTCGHCKAKNSIYISAETALVTEPLYDEPTPNTSSTNGI